MKATIFSIIMLLCLVWLPAQVTNSGSLQVHSGVSVAVLGDFSNNGTFVDSGQVFLLNGSALQNLSGTASTTFKNLKLSNASGARMQRNVSISNTLNLDNGPLQLNANTLTIMNSQTTAISRTSGYLVSERTDNASVVAWQINNTVGNHVFPLGTASGAFIPFTFNLTGGNVGTFSLATYPTNTDNTPLPTTPVAVTHLLDSNNNDNSSNVVDRFWYLSQSGVGGTATLTFSATAPEVGVISGMVAQRWNEGAQGWDEPLPGQSSTATTATVPGVNQYSVWVLAASGHPLPIELLTFAAREEDELVKIEWSTATETQSDFFTIEKTLDFEHFEDVVKVDAAGISNSLLEYETIDAHPYQGQSWYRLKETDISGQTQYSEFASVYFGAKDDFQVNVYPIPASVGNINLAMNNCLESEVSVEIFDVFGRLEYYKVFSITDNNVILELSDCQALSSGTKTIRIINGSSIVSQKIIIQP